MARDIAAAGARSPLDRARRKALLRLVPLCFACYVVAYIDRYNVAIAKLAMQDQLPGFDGAVFSLGVSAFYWGYVLLEIPGTLLVERWSARKWFSRIMITWGVLAACQALVRTPGQFYLVRFLLGLAEAGFYPGIIVYFTHWFPTRDRARALSYFFVATPLGQVLNPLLSKPLLAIGSTPVLGLVDWQWVFVAWAAPAVVLGVVVLLVLPDRPRHARWLTAEEREALEAELARERAPAAGVPLPVRPAQALRHPRVLLLTATYGSITAATLGIEFFLPSILAAWYQLPIGTVATLVSLPPMLAALGQLYVGWSSDRRKERRWHAVVPIAVAVVALALVILTRGRLALTVLFFALAFAGLKAYLPAFWSLPHLFLGGSAAAASVGLINSIGNLVGGSLGPGALGQLERITGSYRGGLAVLLGSALVGLSLLLLAFSANRAGAAAAPGPGSAGGRSAC
jgi:MFS transporter, ACS family, tartrate transporter